jgi:hypothetical protein
MKAKYLGSSHVFDIQGKRHVVTLGPKGEAFVNAEPVCRYVYPGTTKTRALHALKQWQITKASGGRDQ